MTKPSQQNFAFDRPSAVQEPSSLIFAMDFMIPTIVAASAIVIGYFWF